MLNAEKGEQRMESSTLELGEETIRALKCVTQDLFTNKYTLFKSREIQFIVQKLAILDMFKASSSYWKLQILSYNYEMQQNILS